MPRSSCIAPIVGASGHHTSMFWSVNHAGRTPTTTAGAPLAHRPARAPRRSRRTAAATTRAEITTAGGPPGFSSSEVKIRPSAGWTPSKVKRRDSAVPAGTRFRAAVGRDDGPAVRVVDGHLLERTCPLAPVEEVRIRDVQLKVGTPFVEPGDPRRITIRKWFEENAVDDAEDGGVGADAEGKGQDGDRGEAGSVGKSPDCVTEIGQHFLVLVGPALLSARRAPPPGSRGLATSRSAAAAGAADTTLCCCPHHPSTGHSGNPDDDHRGVVFELAAGEGVDVGEQRILHRLDGGGTARERGGGEPILAGPLRRRGCAPR